jgi:dTDP-4-amino-4,6-dideoxygalactose transaminase
MVTTNNEILWRKMWSLKDHGKSYNAVFEREHAPGFRWLHESFGTNWRMMEMQAAIGRIQLKSISDWTVKRNYNADAIRQTCSKYPFIRVPTFDDHNTKTLHAYYKCYVYVDQEQLPEGWSRDRIINEINQLGVPCYQGSCSEVYLEKAFDNTGWRPNIRLPMAKNLGETSLMFLVHPTLTQSEIIKTCDAIDAVLSQISRTIVSFESINPS